MNERDFCYWLKGYFELSENSEWASAELTSKQQKIIKDHLDLVFKKVTPNYGTTLSASEPYNFNVWGINNALDKTPPSSC